MSRLDKGRPSQDSAPENASAVSLEAPAPRVHHLSASAAVRRITAIIRHITGTSSPMTKDEQRELAETIVYESRYHGFSPELIVAVIKAESSFNTESRSPKGALGLMQLLPQTALGLAKLDDHALMEKALLDPAFNVRLGTRYLAKLFRRYGDLEIALIAYNRGPGFVDQRLSDIAALRDPYSDKILRHYRLLADMPIPYAVAKR
jgi:soluble lytic murein transglycosylase-like protein